MEESLGSNTGRGYPRGTVPDTPGGLATLLPMATTTTDTSSTRGYTSTKEQLLKRLKRVEGQVRGVEKMVEDDRYCIDVLTQISAIQAALDKVALGLMDDHARHCVIGGPSEVKEERTEELMAAVARLMRRG
jgi:CsoR family transcriptional regulator, copper-sensing transcriptional repressor